MTILEIGRLQRVGSSITVTYIRRFAYGQIVTAGFFLLTIDREQKFAIMAKEPCHETEMLSPSTIFPKSMTFCRFYTFQQKDHALHQRSSVCVPLLSLWKHY
jgi:hypothetical protein